MRPVFDRLERRVTAGDGAVIRLCERSSFVDSGRPNALAANPALHIIQISLDL